MLDFLRIRNLALIHDLELELAPGLNVITGETGAGKSFILKALAFLFGDKLGPELVRAGEDKAVVEAIFRQDDLPGAPDLLLRRELSAGSGRSRLFVGETLSSIESVQALRPKLLLHVGQHGQQKLLSPAYQAQLVDALLDDPAVLTRRDEALALARELAHQRRQLADKVRELADKRELLEFQRQEIAKVAPTPGEEAGLLARREVLRGLEGARKARQDALGLLGGDEGLASSASRLVRHLEALSRALPSPEGEPDPLAEDLELVKNFALSAAELENRLRRLSVDAAASASGPLGDMDVEAVESRLYALAQLRRRLKRDLDEIVHLGQEIEANISFLDAAGLDDRRLAREEAAAMDSLRQSLTALALARQAAAARFCNSMAEELRALGFSEHLRLAVEFEPRQILPGLDEPMARILWQPNPGQPPQPLDRIASGGELSRFLLAVSRLMTRQERPTLIFDEIDAGIGGHTLVRVAQRLEELAAAQQLLVITHWPVLAARAQRHFLVSKEVEGGQTFTRCQQLDPAQSRRELARMAGQADPAPQRETAVPGQLPLG